MADQKTITPDNSGFPDFIDFNFLRTEGVRYIAGFSGDLWTDHNLHDPGITILEALCFVLTDLDYRTRLDFRHLIAAPPNSKTDDNFFTPAQILGNNPLTISDIRKLLLDIRGVRNAWLEKAIGPAYSLAFDCNDRVLKNASPQAVSQVPVPLQGLYKVCLELDDVYASANIKDACGNAFFPQGDVLQEVQRRLTGHRNLCEDITDVVVLKDEPISLCLHLELKAEADTDDVLTDVFSRIQDFFSPAPRFYTLAQILAKGYTMDEIFEGRPYNFAAGESTLQNGFVDPAELAQLKRHEVLYASDLYRIIMEVPGIAGITRLVMFSHARKVAPEEQKDKSENKFTTGEEWCMKLEPDSRPVLAPDLSNIIFFKNNLPFQPNLKVVKERYIRNISDYNKAIKKPSELDHAIPQGRNLDLAQYHSVQYEFPAVYGIGKNRLPDTVSPLRKAQVLQLQAYLLFYDQLLGDYFAQLSHLRQLFSLSAVSSGPAQTYFQAGLDAIPQAQQLSRFSGAFADVYSNTSELAFPVDPSASENSTRSQKFYASLLQREEAIRYIILLCSNNRVGARCVALPNGLYGFELLDQSAKQNKDEEDDDEECRDEDVLVLLRSSLVYEKKKKALQAAMDAVYLATGESNYRRSNRQKEGKFTFSLIYNDKATTDLMAGLNETTEAYQQRKDRFLNHLLSRFAEDFTDYVLLMYALNGKRTDLGTNIRDKTAFLSHYPEVSANRAQAFDYTINSGDAFPQCGLQKRVYGLMGIQPEAPYTLQHFDLIEAREAWRFVLYLPDQKVGDTPLFRSQPVYGSKEEAAAAYRAFLAAAKEGRNYQRFGCESCEEGVNGFWVQTRDDRGRWIKAEHPLTYTDTDEREDIINWLQNFFTNNGRYHNFILAREGFYFLLRDDAGKLLLKSTTGYATEPEAFDAACQCLEALQNREAYRVQAREETADFVIQIWQHDSAGETVIAQHPVVFASESDAEAALEKLFQYFRIKHLVYQQDRATVYNWRLKQEERITWSSAFSYNHPDQLTPAFFQFLTAAASEENYRVQFVADGDYSLDVIRKENVEEEESPFFTTLAGLALHFETEAEAKTAAGEYAVFFRRFLQGLGAAVREVSASLYAFLDPEPPSGLPENVFTTLQPIGEGPERGQLIRSIIQNAADPQKLIVATPVDNESSCLFVVRLLDDLRTAVAESPVLADRETATRLQDRILFLAQQNMLLYERKAAANGFLFEWTDSAGNAVLKSLPVWNGREEAMMAELDWVLSAAETDFTPTQTLDGGFGFILQQPGKPALARQSHSYATATTRNEAILQIMAMVRSLSAGLFWEQAESHHFYFQIKDGDLVLLQEDNALPDLQTARKRFYQAVSRGNNRTSYRLTETGHCTYGFLLTGDDGSVLALHSKEYTAVRERNEALQRTIRFLQEHGREFSLQYLPGVWRYQWQWLSCHLTPEVALEGLNEKANQEEAEAELAELFRLATAKENYQIQKEEGGYYIYLKQQAAAQRLAVHPKPFTCEGVAKQVVERLLLWANFSLDAVNLQSVFTGDQPYAGLSLCGPSKDSAFPVKNFSYRLWKRHDRLAQYLPVFPSAAARQRAVDALYRQYQQQLPSFTHLETGDNILIPVENGFRFQVRVRGEAIWQSALVYETPEEARHQFEEQVFIIMRLAKNRGAYNQWENSLGFVQLSGEKGDLLATSVKAVSTATEFEASIAERMALAFHYPIFQSNKEFFFQLYNSKTRQYEWRSMTRFASAEEAWKQFSLFLQLLRYRGSYFSIDKPESYRYELALVKVLLDSRSSSDYLAYLENHSGKDEKEEMVLLLKGTDAKDQLLMHFLEKIQRSEDNFFRYTDYAQQCRYAFRVTGMEYLVAKHTGWYQSLEERESVRRDLLSDLTCRKRFYTHVLQPEKTADDLSVAPCYFPKPEKIDFEHLWTSISDFPKQAQWRVFQNSEDGLFYFELHEAVAEKRSDMRGTGQNEKTVIWRSVNGYRSQCEAEVEQGYRYVYLMELARVAACYWYAQVPFREKQYTLSLKDETGKVVAVAPGFVCEADLEVHQATRMVNAMLYPVMQDNHQFLFELNDVGQNVTQSRSGTEWVRYQYQTVWESARSFVRPDLAFKELDIAIGLLANLDNYERLDDSEGGPFGLQLVNPDHVIAHHPLTYQSRGEREAAIKEVKAAINTEGFHLLEHILLRPTQQAKAWEQFKVVYNLSGSEGKNGFINTSIDFFASTSHAADKDRSAGQLFLDELKIAEVHISGNEIYIRNSREVLLAQGAIPQEAFNVDHEAIRQDLKEWFGKLSVEHLSKEVYVSGDEPLLQPCTEPGVCTVLRQPDPDNGRCDQTFLVDTYSFNATVVVPSWPKRFHNLRFRQFLENTIRKEAPAHIRMNIVWVSPGDMYRFEEAYTAWLKAFWQQGLMDDRTDNCRYRKVLQELISVLTGLKNIYPPLLLSGENGGSRSGQMAILDEGILTAGEGTQTD